MDWLTQLLQNMPGMGAGGAAPGAGGYDGSPILPGASGGEAAPMGVPDQPYQTPNSLGEALQPQGQQGGVTKGILDSLKGVQAMPKPDVVKPSSPAVPHTAPIQAGELMAMLRALGPQAGMMPRPMTLGQDIALRQPTGRY